MAHILKQAFNDDLMITFFFNKIMQIMFRAKSKSPVQKLKKKAAKKKRY